MRRLEVVETADSNLPIWPRWSLLLLAAIAVVDILWLAVSPLSISPHGWAGAANGAIFAAAAAMLLRRLNLPPQLRMLLAGLALILAAWPALRVYNHLVMTMPVPLADAWLSAADRMLGFDWLAYVGWVDSQPLLIRLMSWAYGGLTGYSIITFVLVLIVIGAERAREFVLLFLLAAVAASTVGMFFPAEAAMVFYDPAPDLFQSVTSRTGTYHIELLRELRSDPAHAIALDHLPGLTTFPSFHTAMGIVCIWCSRGSTALFAPLLSINLVMIASTPVFGSHYLIDVIGGVVVAAGAIVVLRILGSKGISQSRAGAHITPTVSARPSATLP